MPPVVAAGGFGGVGGASASAHGKIPRGLGSSLAGYDWQLWLEKSAVTADVELASASSTARLPARRGSPGPFGVHSAIAEHYGVPVGSEAERATTFDYIVAAAAD